jgi:hypothetical protein
MFRALLVHPQEVLYKRHLVYCVRVMSAGCTRIEVGSTAILVQPAVRTDNSGCVFCVDLRTAIVSLYSIH